MGALPEVPDDDVPDDDVPDDDVPDDDAPEPLPPGIAPTPGDPDVAVPTDFGRDMDVPLADPGRSPLFSALPLDGLELLAGAVSLVSDGMVPWA